MNTTSLVPPSSSQHTQAASAELALTLLGPSPSMAQLWSQMRRLAPHVRTVLLTGCPDCGQEAIARLLLDLSSHPRRPFVILNEDDAEHRLAQAHTPGTLGQELFLYLPCVDRLSPAAQEHLLRIVRHRRPGAFTVVAATHENLRALVGMGRFSAELAEVLAAVRLAAPTLKERGEDLPMILSQMLSLRCLGSDRSMPQLSEPVLRAAMQHPWPGNLRELSAMVDVLLKCSRAERELTLAHWEHALGRDRASVPADLSVRMIRLDTVIQEHIYGVLNACAGNKLRAAETLGISRSTLYRMLEAATENTPMPLAN